MNQTTPESRTATVGVGVTPSEKRAIELVATVEGKTVADLLRPTVESLVAQGSAYASRLRDMEPAA